MADWKEYKFSDLVKINAESIGRNYPYQEIKYLDTGSITRGKIDDFQVYKISDAPSRAKRLVKDFDIVYSTVRPIQRHYGLIRKPLENLVVSTGFAVLSVIQEKADPKYLYYFLTSDEVVNYLDVVADGSTSAYPSLTPNVIADLDILLPPLPEQQAIAEVLSTLDDKIDLLHRQNKTLEELAETLFRQRFVEEAEESWNNKKLGDFIEIKHGYAFKGASITADETDKILVTPGNFKIGGGFNSHKYKYFNSEDFPVSYVLDEGDFVVTMTDLSQDNDTLGYPAFIPEIKGKRLLHNQRVGKVLVRKSHSDKRFFLYHLMKSAEYRHYVLGSSSGMAVAHTSPNSIYGFEFNVPPDSLITRFEKQAKKFYEKERANQKQIQTLTTLRDTLLPKLMSGEVRVKVDEAETAIANQ
jgi:type I restriction enzyme S subunit